MILRSKVEKVEFDEKNSKYFANVEKKRAEAKIINKLNVKIETRNILIYNNVCVVLDMS